MDHFTNDSMKVLNIVFFIIVCNVLVAKSYPQRNNGNEDRVKRTEWWQSDRFGMFIHFGVYSVAGRGEWVKSVEKLTNEEYQKYVDAFVPEDFNPVQWAKKAKDAGMKYAVLTAKHHDGYCLFDSKQTDYKISVRFNGRDLVKEFLEAFRAEGLKVGLYYSLIDWHHPDYPNVGNHPQRDDQEYSKKTFNWDNYLNYMHSQVEELMSKYGKIDILWLDYSFDNYHSEKWKAKELVEMVRKHQPEILLNNRLEINLGTTLNKRELGYGDFETPEQGIPEEPLLDGQGKAIPWETCLTLNNNWGYAIHDNDWKSPQTVIHALVNCVSKNGNLLLNIGPDGMGKFPDRSVEILSEVGKWMRKNGESIYGCGSANMPKPDWGRFTQKGDYLYIHWMNPTIGPIKIKNMEGVVNHAVLLSNGSELPTANSWWGDQSSGNFFVNFNAPIHFTFPMPDPYNSVIRIQLKNQ